MLDVDCCVYVPLPFEMPTERSEDYCKGYTDALNAVRAELRGKRSLVDIGLAAIRVTQLRPPQPTTMLRPQRAIEIGWSVTLVPLSTIADNELSAPLSSD